MIKWLKDKKKLTSFLYILGFVTSGVLTLKLLTSNSVDATSKMLGASMTLIFEFGKGICFMESQNKQKHKENIRSVLFSMWIFLTALSIFASQSFLVNETNKLENDSIKTSKAYIQMQDKETRLKEQIRAKQDMLNKQLDINKTNIANAQSNKESILKQISDYNKTIQSIQSQINSRQVELAESNKKKWWSTSERITSVINQLKQSLKDNTVARDKLNITDSNVTNNNTESLNAEIDSLNKELNTIDYSTIKVESKATDGYTAMLKVLANVLSIQLDTLTFFFYLLITIAFEILICLLYYISNTYTNSTLIEQREVAPMQMQNTQPIYQVPTQEQQQQEYIPVPKPNIGFSYSNSNTVETLTNTSPHDKDISQEDIKKYMEYMYQNKKGNVSPGYRTIGESVGIDTEVARKIKAHLERIGILEVKGNKTLILK